MTYIGYITGPRAEQPVGVRVVEPPPNTRQQQRGNLYIVVELAGEHPNRAAITDRLLSEVQRAYYTLKGSQSQVMVDSVQAAQRLLREVNTHTPQYPLGAGILCAALMPNRLLVASSGPAFALVRASERVHMFPGELDADFDVSGEAVEIYRQDVQPDDAFFLGGGSWLRRVAVRTLVSVVFYTNAENCNDAADELYEQAGMTPLPGLLVVVGTPPASGRPGDGSGGAGIPPRPPASPPTGGHRRPRFGALPTALSASPPARMPPAPPSALSSEEMGPPSAAVQSDSTETDLLAYESDSPSPVRYEELPELSELGPAIDDEPEPEAAAPETMAETFELPRAEASPAAVPRAETHPPVEEIGGPTRPALVPQEPDADFDPLFPAQDEAEEEESRSRWTQRLALSTGLGLKKMRTFFSDMLPERTAAEPEAPARARQNLEPIGEVAVPAEDEPYSVERNVSTREPPADEDAEVAWDDTPADRADAPVMPTPVLDVSPFAPPQPTQGARARLFVLVALAILVLVPSIAFALRIGQGMNIDAEAERLTGRAELILLGAQKAMDEGDKVTARNRLDEAEGILAEAVELGGMNDHRAELAATIKYEMNELTQVKPLYGLTSPLITFGQDAQPSKVLVISEDIFVIDKASEQLLAYRFDPSTGQVTDQIGQVILQQGDIVDGVTVGALADMAWLPLVPGFEDRPSLLIVDRNNNVLRYDPRVEGASVLDLAGKAEWGSLGQIQTFGGRIYVADELQGSILRYSPGPGPGQYAIPPDPWFATGTTPDLAGLVAMEIDGDIWLLINRGSILRYRNGEQLAFSSENIGTLVEDPVDMYVTRQDTDLIYVVDAAEDRLLVYDKNGAYLSQLQEPEEGLLRGLSSLYIDEVSGVMYLLTQNGLFSHPLIY